MACDTFLKIAQRSKRHFVMQQPGEQQPFVEEILRLLHQIIADLSAPQVCPFNFLFPSQLMSSQIQMFYEAIGYMISAQPNKVQQERLIAKLMKLPNDAVCQRRTSS